MMTNAFEEPRVLLQKVFAQRMAANPAYSLRAFARQLGVPVTRMSEFFTGRRGLSEAVARKIARSLSLSVSEREAFLLQVRAHHGRSQAVRTAARRVIADTLNETSHTSTLDLESFQIVAEWHHYAILELIEIAAYAAAGPKEIAAALKINSVEVELALLRLQKVGLLERNEKGVYRAVSTATVGPNGLPSEAVRQHHRQLLAKAATALDTTPIDERDENSVILSLGEQDLPLVREELKNFRDRLRTRLGDKALVNRVYCIMSHVFPLSQAAPSKAKVQIKKAKQSPRNSKEIV